MNNERKKKASRVQVFLNSRDEHVRLELGDKQVAGCPVTSPRVILATPDDRPKTKPSLVNQWVYSSVLREHECKGLFTGGTGDLGTLKSYASKGRRKGDSAKSIS